MDDETPQTLTEFLIRLTVWQWQHRINPDLECDYERTPQGWRCWFQQGNQRVHIHYQTGHANDYSEWELAELSNLILDDLVWMDDGLTIGVFAPHDGAALCPHSRLLISKS